MKYAPYLHPYSIQLFICFLPVTFGFHIRYLNQKGGVMTRSMPMHTSSGIASPSSRIIRIKGQ